MDHFTYRSGELFCERVPVSRIAEDIGTPVYIYSAATLRHHYQTLAGAFAPLDPIICYSIKSCPNINICRLLKSLGSGFDVVSGGELYRATEIGADPAKIVFAGVGKTDDEIGRAIDAKIGWFNVESEAELQNLVRLARARGAVVNAALRVNPDVDPKTHRYTSTGKMETKFGVNLQRAQRVFEAHGRQGPVRLCAVHLHIGSPVNSPAPYVEAIGKTLALIGALRSDGYEIDTIDIGGGFGAHYRSAEAPDLGDYAEAIVPLLAGQGLRVIMEPGRSIAANAGILLARTLYLKKSGERDFLIVDAGMSELLRPALYEAFHFIWPARPESGFVPERRSEDLRMPGLRLMDVVGPLCESGDFLAKNRMLPPVKRGDLIATFSSGAYGMAMASHYNSRPNPPEVLVDGDTVEVIRRRESYDDLLEKERAGAPPAPGVGD